MHNPATKFGVKHLCINLLRLKLKLYLWWVNQIEGMIESEVDETQESCVELCESCHDSVVNICRVLKEQNKDE